MGFFYRDFKIDLDKNRIMQCPQGHEPSHSYFNQSKKTFDARFNKELCSDCMQVKECLVKERTKEYILKFSLKSCTELPKTKKENATSKREFHFQNKKNEKERLEEITKKYDHSLRLLSNEHTRKAAVEKMEELLQDTIDFPEKLGCYNSIANYYVLKSAEEETEQYDMLIENYLDSALKINPRSPLGLETYFFYYFFKKQFSKAASYLIRQNNKDKFEDNLQVFLGATEAERLTKEEDTDFLEACAFLCGCFPRKEELHYTYAQALFFREETLKAYNILKNLYKQIPGYPNYASMLSLCCCTMKKYKEAEQYAKEGLKFFDLNSENLHLASPRACEQQHEARCSLVSNLALSLNGQHKYDRVVQLLEENLKLFPNNTDYHNLGYSYYKIKKFKEAEASLKKALHISEDETTYLIMGENYYAAENYSEALNWYKKSLAFIMNEDSKFTFKDGKMLTSSYYIEADEEFPESIRAVFIGLISSTIELEDYITAQAYYEMALEKLPFNSDIEKLGRTVKRLISKDAENKIIKEKITDLKEELMQQRNDLIEKINKVRDWAVSLLKLQNSIENGLFEQKNSENLWKQIENKMLQIAEKMKQDGQKENPEAFQKIKDDFQKRYPKLDAKALLFLSTGEYLFQSNKDETLDYAPVMLEFCKVFEVQLNLLLKEKKLISAGENSNTLGQLLYKLRDLHIYPHFITVLEKVLEHRNGSAHSSATTRRKVKEVRDLLLQQGWIDFLIIK